ncbi:MAG: hypothetical protein WC208_14555 [Gallionella sp.]|jgi:hypothetical protein
MSISLPVNMIPLAGRAAKSGGFVIAVMIGLALFAAAQAAKKPAAHGQPGQV